MEENLIGYLLNALDPATERDVETYLRERPEAGKQLEKLRLALAPLEADRDTIDPPADLASRTLTRVEALRPAPAAPASLLTAPPAGFTWWRRPDVLVAAVLLFAALGIGAPGLVKIIEGTRARSVCSNQMRDAYTSLVDYSQLHGGNFPRAEDQPRHNVAGVYVPILNDAGVLPPNFSTRCPSKGEPGAAVRTMRDLEQMPQEEFDALAPRLSGCYSYSLGYRDAQGQLHGLRADDGDDLPLLSDRPLTGEESADCTGVRCNSPNHGGQNVLYIGGYVRFHKSPNVGRGGDHIFLNRKNEVKAGVDPSDTVLGMSADQP
jgi:hypothetical protein